MFNGVVETTTKLGAELGALAREAGVPVFQTQLGTMSCMFFHDGPIKSYSDATASDTKRYAKFFWGMLERGVYLAPSQYEAAFTSIAHGPSEIDQTLSAAKAAFAAL